MPKTTLNQKQKQKILKWVEEAKGILDLQFSRILTDFVKEGPEGLYADVDTSYVYQSGSIHVYENNVAELWEEFGEEEVQPVIFHEVAHIFLCPVGDLGAKRFINENQYNAAIELLTEKISYVALKLSVGYNKNSKQ